VAVSPSSVWRVLGKAGLLRKWKGKPSKKGTGFEQPLQPHEHWHTDVSYINILGTFYYLCSVLGGCSRLIAHWDLREAMRVRALCGVCSTEARAGKAGNIHVPWVHALLWHELKRPFCGLATYGGKADEGKAPSDSAGVAPDDA
jgi:transposase InsO family protein